jgi:hypothetical protein
MGEEEEIFLTVDLQLPAVLHGRVGQLWVLCPAGHVLPGVADGGDVVDDAESDVAVGARLQRILQGLKGGKGIR